jgi:hypothetical protein
VPVELIRHTNFTRNWRFFMRSWTSILCRKSKKIKKRKCYSRLS